MDILKNFTNNIISRVSSTEVTVNCWFCNENSTIYKSDQQSWVCPSCEQYNGFNEDGDYNKELKEQYVVRYEKTKTYCTTPAEPKGVKSVEPKGVKPVESKGVKSLLCDQCSQNQVIKVRQLAAFTPFHEIDYDREVDMYSNYLEQLYQLCPTCEAKVKAYLGSLNSSLLGQLDESQKQKLARIRQRDIVVDQRNQLSTHKSSQSLLSRLVLVKSALCTLVLGLVNLRLMAGSLGTVGGTVRTAGGSMTWSYLTDELVGFLVTAIPGHLALDIRSSIGFIGATLCLCGLYLAGKYSYYPEDVLHLLLWLVTVVVLSVTDVPISWNLCLNCCTLCVSVVCCVRDRLPRNLTSACIHRKEVLKMTRPSESIGDTVSFSDNSPLMTPRSSSPSSMDKETSEPLTQFEAVRQNLESVSLGLGRRTGSSSSVWTVPSIVTPPVPSLSSTELAPDSSSPHQQTLPRRALLSPSRLGFISSDFHKEISSELSRSPSPWSRSPSPWSPVGTQPPATNSALHPVLKPSFPQNHCSSGECDSTQGPCDPQQRDYRGPPPRMSMSADSLDVGHIKQGGDPLILKPKALRRSTRIAMAGRPMKPWKLQKSQSFACCYDFNDRQAPKDLPVLQLNNKTDRSDPEFKNHKLVFQKEPLLKPSKIPTLSGTTKQELRINRHSVSFNKNDCLGLSDVSDEEGVVVSKESVQRNKVNIGQDFSWQWILLGLVIGISITTNVFLLYGNKERTS